MGQDPIPFVNRYPYVGNNPANFIDPAGLWGVPGIPVDFPDPGDVIDEAEDVIDEVVDAVVYPALEFLTDPETLIFIGQAIGAGAIVLTCPSVVVVCAAGITLYIYVSAYEVASSDSICEAFWNAATSAAGGIPWIGAAGYVVATGSGAGDAILCDTLAPPPVYSDNGHAGSDKESR